MSDQGWTPDRAFAWLEELQRRGMLLGLERVERLAEMLENPQESFPSILIAGTNGKGTVAAILDSILTHSGIRTGRYTSPHLIEWNERITVDGVAISDKELARALEAVSRGADEVEATPFEALTMAAFWHFRGSNIDRGVLEVGMGGRLDATRICHADLTVVTTIDRDHTSELGDELDEIAREKGAIARAGAPLLLGPGTDRVQKALQEQARELGVQTFQAADLVQVQGADDGGWGIRGEARMAGPSEGHDGEPRVEYHLPLAGEHMLANLTTALGAIVLLRQSAVVIGADAIAEGIARVDWRGRLQAIPSPSGGPAVLLDVGHTPSAVQQVLEEIGRRRPDSRLHVVLAVAEDKDVDGILREVVEKASMIVVTAWEGSRASEPKRLSERAGRIVGESGGSPHIVVEHDPVRALSLAADILGEEDVVLVIGSHMLVGTVLGAVRNADGMDLFRRE